MLRIMNMMQDRTLLNPDEPDEILRLDAPRDIIQKRVTGCQILLLVFNININILTDK